MARLKIGNVFPPVAYLLKHCAPSGYGLGEDTKQFATISEIDSLYTSGLYWVSCIGANVEGTVFNYALLRVSGIGTTHCIQELFPIGLDMMLVRRGYEGTWPAKWGKINWTHSVPVEMT